MEQLISGAMMMGYSVAGLFFLRFWKRTGDRLFVLFALAFWVLAGQRLALALASETIEDDTIFYIVRLSAFVLILVAIIDKNRSPK
ncbi:MAG: hypothetical protein EOO38_09245 [Cytophagaceae bacterium]|nr:MAG: hypothetical protein EOO38_09245 [Cytophagaceae bacterium]